MAHEFKAQLVRVVDGDTIDADIHLGFNMIHERSHPFNGYRYT